MSSEDLRKDNARIEAESDALRAELVKTELGRLIVEAESRREDTTFFHMNGASFTVFGTWSHTPPFDERKGDLNPIAYREIGSTWVRLP